MLKKKPYPLTAYQAPCQARRESRHVRRIGYFLIGRKFFPLAVRIQKVIKHLRNTMCHSVSLRRNLPRLAALVALATPGALTWAQTATWQGGTGNWNNTGQWDTGTVPNSTTNVQVDGGKTGTASLVNVNVTANANTLTIDAGDQVDINNGRQLTINGASLLNNGTLSLSSAGSTTTLRIGNITFSGTGVVNLSNQAQNRITGSSSLSVLTNAAGHTIQGSGSITQVGLNNQGLIDANQSVPLTISLSSTAPTRSNSGTLQASNSGTLIINSTTLDNTGGVIQALDASKVQLNSNVSINDGVLDTAGTGVIEVTSGAYTSSARLEDVTNQGRIEVQNGRGLTVAGTITNDGMITLNPQSSSTSYLHVDNGETATLSGTGALVIAGNSLLSNRSGNSTQDTANAITLVNDTDHTIRGAGDGGASTLTMNSNVTLDNQGTILANNGDTLNLSGGFIDNTGGLIQAQDGSTVGIASNTRIANGVLDTDGTGVIEVTSGAYTSSARLEDVTNQGRIEVQNGRGLTVAGTITNDGMITLNPQSSSTSYLHVDNGETATLSGTGALVIAGNSLLSNRSGNSTQDTANAITLVNDTDHTIRGAGDGGASTLTMNSNVTLDNQGTILANNGDTLNLSGGFIDNTGGLIQAQDGSTVGIASNTRIANGVLDTAGTGVIQITSGSFTNSARLEDVTNQGQIAVQNSRGLTVAGTLTNDGTLTLGSGTGTGYLHVDNGETATLSGTGALVIGGNAYLINRSGNGTLDAANAVTLVNDTDHTIRGAGDGETHELRLYYSNVTLENQGTILAHGGDTLNITGGGVFTSTGTVRATDNSAIEFGSSVTQSNNQAGVLTDGRWEAVSTGNGATIALRGDAITDNAAEIVLSGAGSVIGVRPGTSTTQLTTLEDSLTTNQATGVLRIVDNRDYTTSNDLTNAGVIQLGGGTLDANSLTNTDTGVLTGHGTVTPRPVNSGLIEATGGTLAMTGGIQGGSGTVTIQPDGALDLSAATQSSSADFLNHQGTAPDSLNLGNNDFVVFKDYTNANSGTGNSFDARANVTGTGQIIGENADLTITGAVTPSGSNTVTLDLGNVRGETSTTVDYQIANTGTGADIRGAVQTAAGTGNITDARLSGSGVTAQNFGPVEAGTDSGNLSVTFTATSGGSLNGQTIGVVSNFDNVAGQTIEITGMATALAQGNATPAPGPVNLGNFRVGQDGVSQDFAVENTTSGSGAEQLGIGTATTTGNFAASNNLGAGLINGGTTQANALSASVSNGQAGVNTGSLDIQYTTDGTQTDASFTAINSNTQSIALTATGFNMAEGSASPDPVVIANQRVGGAESQTLTVANTAPTGAFTEGLNASFGANSGDAVSKETTRKAGGFG